MGISAPAVITIYLADLNIAWWRQPGRMLRIYFREVHMHDIVDLYSKFMDFFHCLSSLLVLQRINRNRNGAHLDSHEMVGTKSMPTTMILIGTNNGQYF